MKKRMLVVVDGYHGDRGTCLLAEEDHIEATEVAGADTGTAADAALLSSAGSDPAHKKQKQAPSKSEPALPWMKVPISIEAGTGVHLAAVRGMDTRLAHALRADGYSELFPVQAAVWRELAGGSSFAHDLCISAPTGSGKTLAYLLPLLQGASMAIPLHTLRALVVLPTRELAQQVFEVCGRLCPSLRLRAVLVAGRQPMAEEADALACRQSLGREGALELNKDISDRRRGAEGVDIVMATPGRLVAHLSAGEGFTLRDLRYLVVDEADRLLKQSYQSWLPLVLKSAGSSREEGAPRRLLKLVASATLTRDPAKLGQLQLTCPRYIAMSAQDHRYRLPQTLQEYKLVVGAAQKPAALLALLAQLEGQTTLVFAASVEAAHRLALLLQQAWPGGRGGSVIEYSSHIAAKTRAENLAAFRRGEAHVLVASDAATRGVDVVGIANVVNYDVPHHARVYVHRAGRTARAGRTGRVFSLLQREEVHSFSKILRKTDNNFVSDWQLPPQELQRFLHPAAAALAATREALEKELQVQSQQRRSSDTKAAGQFAQYPLSESDQRRLEQAVRKTLSQELPAAPSATHVATNTPL